MSNYETAQLFLASPQPLEIRIYDSNFAIVGRGFGNYEDTAMKPGIYQVELRAGASSVQFLLRLAPGQRYQRFDLKIAISSAAPLPNTDNFHKTHFDAAQRLSTAPLIRRGSNLGGILLFARNVSKIDMIPKVIRSFEWTVFDSNYVEIFGIREQTLWSAEGFAGISIGVDPGGYLLRVKNNDDRDAIDLPIWVSPGWQTMVFLPISAQTGNGDRKKEGSKVRVNSASVHLAPLSGWYPANDDASLNLALAVETCLPALAAGHVLVPRRQISQMFNEKFQDPMFGLVGAYCICLERLRKKSYSGRSRSMDELGNQDSGLLHTVLNNLATLLGPRHPDLAGLRATLPPNLRDGPLPTEVAWPPMIGLGYQALVRSENQACIVPESLAEQAAGWIESSGPWTVWADWHTRLWGEQRYRRTNVDSPTQEALLSQRDLNRVFDPFFRKQRKPQAQAGDIVVERLLEQHLGELAEQGEYTHPSKLEGNIVQLSSAMTLPINSVRRALSRLIEDRNAFSHHGKPLRGLMSTFESINFQGRFGRMFRVFPGATYGKTDADSRAALMTLGAVMTSEFDSPKDGFDPEECGIPALYTYFGQFIDHDITFDPMTSLIQQSDPDALTDFRTPALDLDNMYGRGPGDQPYLYESGGFKFLLGKKLANGAPDLPRNGDTPARALIGDSRNDENSIVSQLQCLMLRFHNRVVDDNRTLSFQEVQKTVRWHYQWVVLHDFLPRIVSGKVLDELKSHGRYEQSNLKFFHWRNEPFVPVEFSVAAYRFGHSMIRPGYRLNNDDSTLLPIFPISPNTIPDIPKGLSSGLTGFQEMAANRGIDWGRFIDLEGDIRPYGGDPDKIDPADAEMKGRLQFAYRIDASVVTPLSVLPGTVASDSPPSLAQRNLLRSLELGLPTGQDVARAMHVKPLDDRDIIIGKAVDSPSDGDVKGSIATVKGLEAFKGKCPLWTYILAEAAQNRARIAIPVKEKKTVSTPQLGPVGGRIVAEVFLGMMFGDNDSFLVADPEWTPTIRGKGENFALRDIVAFAIGK